jgi:oxygen-independent coproporphyrinogen-3 oxidase
MQTVSADLLRRYDRPGPRYTSYPTAVEFAESVNAETYALHLERASKVDAPLSFYIHLPFCEERCLFCGCNVVISKNHEIASHYLPLLHREIRDVAKRLRPRRRLSQYHWGGGTPTYLSPAQMRELQAVVRGEFEIEPGAEVAIEVDPRVTSVEQMETLRDLGFNRLSMGVQDFTPEVQEAVNRIQPFDRTCALVETGRRLGFQSVNIDLIYGLPLQTPATFAKTLEQVVSIRPDRLAVYSYAHVPWLKGQQRRIDEAQLPKPETKLELFVTAHRALAAAGYVSVGMDHFALPEDEMGRALLDGTLWRNFMGYTVKHAPDMVACGVSGIGDVAGAFFQNEKNLAAWQRAVSEGRLPIERGYVLSEDDKLRRHVITSLMCTFRVDVADVERRFGIRFWERFAPERPALEALEGDGFVKVSKERIEVVGLGRLFVRNVCMTFDAFLASKNDGKQRFSRTV